MSVREAITTLALVDGQATFQAVQIPYACTITGAWFVQTTQGDYTADNSNQVGLFSFDGTTMTKLAASADDGTLWKKGNGTFNQKAFSATYAAAPGTYYVAALYNNSAQVTAPKILASDPPATVQHRLDIASGKGISLLKAGQTSLGDVTSLTTYGSSLLLGLY
jgi:hypothetical protein